MSGSLHRSIQLRSAHLRKNTVFALALLAVPLGLGTGTAAFGVASTPPVATDSASVAPVGFHSAALLEAALRTYATERMSAETAIEAGTSVVATAQAALDASAGKTLTEDSRLVLAPVLDQARQHLGRAAAELTDAAAAADLTVPVGALFTDRPTAEQSMTTLSELDFDHADRLAELHTPVPDAVQGVTDAVAAWNAEQARLAAIEAARVAAIEAARVAAIEATRVADAAAAAQAARATSGPGPSGSAGTARSAGTPQAAAPRAAPVTPAAPSAPPVAAPAAASYNKTVWASGFQAEIDACRGAVDVTGRYGVAVIAEHWSCGGSRFPGAGATVTLSGVSSGTYRVGGVVAILNEATDSTGSIPRGYDLLYQTCINGSSARMSFTTLTRIG